MDENSKKEEFSYGYVHTLAACGYIIQRSERALDNLGIDLEIINSENLDNAEAPRISVQAKCTTPKYFIEGEQCFKYDLEVKNYNQLRKKSIDPRILIIVLVPEEIKDWMEICPNKQETLLKKCGYWVSLKGKEETSNAYKVIEIPKQNVLKPEALEEIMRESLKDREEYFGYQENFIKPDS